MTKLFLHGVPDTPALWQPLVEALHLNTADYIAPAMPGFGSPIPKGFSSTKESYLEWLTDLLEREYARGGPVDLVGHDWGAILCMRAAHIKPELVRSWTVLNAVLVPDYEWHSTARIRQIPILGEISMMLSRQASLENFLVKAGMPADIANHESKHVDRTMKRSILKLYRSAKNMKNDWVDDVSGLPKQGLVIWGERDPYVGVEHAVRFCQMHSFPLHLERGAGHWAVCQRPTQIAAQLYDFWKSIENS